MPRIHLARALVAVSSAALYGCGSSASQSRVEPMPASSNARSGNLDARERARHALDRLAFGPKPGDVDAVVAMGVDHWIARQLAPESIPDNTTAKLAVLESQTKTVADLMADHPSQIEVGRLLRSKGPNGQLLEPPPGIDSAFLRRVQQRQQQLNVQVNAAKTLRAVESDRQLLEVITDFWENHFSVYSGKTLPYALLQYDHEVIRPRALGKFKDLLLAVAKSPAMLYYLDNWQSAVDSLHSSVDERPATMRRLASSDPDARAFAQSPHRRLGPAGLNENYARELMELHTLGVDGGYTQQDVINVARAFTGWTLDLPVAGAKFIFRPELHDADEKVVLGHTLAAGRGMEDGDDVLRILASSPTAARFITMKLARHFIADDPPMSVVDRCTNVYLGSDGDIRETMRCIVTGPEFFSRGALHAKVKTPFEVVISTARALGGTADTTQRLARQMAMLGQPVFGRQTPDGWPDRGGEWLNSGAVLNRINFAMGSVTGTLVGIRPADWPFPASVRNAPRDEQARVVARAILGDDVSPETMSALESGVSRGAAPGVNAQGFASVVGLALGSPEFQRR